MALLLLLIACYLLYTASKYFPVTSVKNKIKLSKNLLKSVAVLMVLATWLLLYLEYEVFSAIIYLLFAMGVLMSALVISLRLSPKWNYVWAVIAILFLLFDFI